MFRVLILLILTISGVCYAQAAVGPATASFEIGEMKAKNDLYGDWDFYWKTTHADFVAGHINNNAVRIHTPATWTQAGYPDKGYGLYTKRFIIKGAAHQRLSLYIQYISNNYNLYVDGYLLSSVGHFDTVPEKVVPAYQPKTVSFFPASDTVLITIEAANYDYRDGGVNFGLAMGNRETIFAYFLREISKDGLMIGGLLLMFFYFGAFYFVRGADLSSLYFSLLCLAGALRKAFTGEYLITQLNIDFPWTWVVKFEFLTPVMMPMFGLLYFVRLLNTNRYQLVVKIFTVINICLFVYILFTNTYLTSYINTPLLLFCAVQLVFMLFIAVRTLFHKEPALIIFASTGYLIVFVFGMNDILFSFGVIQSTYLSYLSILCYVFIQAFVLTRKFSESFKKVEQLSVRLQSINKNQEKVIRERTAELTGYNTIKDKIFTIISHDLRAPIATLSGVLDMAEDADDETVVELRSYFKDIKRSVDNLHLTLDNLLVWSKDQINGMTFEPSPVNLNTEVDSVILLYKLVALKKEITLTADIKESYTLFVDQSHLNLILRNLVSNALKFTNIGGVITVTASQHDSNTIKICVADNGIGMEEDRLVQLFKPEAHSTTYGTMNEKGTGLGLMLCREYAEKNNGSITVESRVGEGTKVSVFLPVFER